MAGRAFFGPPRESFTGGGAHIAVYLVPVFDGRLVVFDVAAREAHGRWLPWDVLDYGANPYEAASTLADDWCATSMLDLTLVDLMSFAGELGQSGSWELAVIFRAELATQPAGDDARTPILLDTSQLDAIGSFDTVDLERWVGAKGTATSPTKAPSGLVF